MAQQLCGTEDGNRRMAIALPAARATALLTAALLRGHWLRETQELGQFPLKPLSPLATTELGDSSRPFPFLTLPLRVTGSCSCLDTNFIFREGKLIFACTAPESLTWFWLLSI